MGSDAGKRIGAKGRRDAWTVDPADLYSPRSDPKHEEHSNWLDRTDPNSPEMIALVESIEQNGTDEGTPIIVYTDGDRTCVAAGDRRTAATIIANKRRKKGTPVFLLRALTTKDPIAARALENACRKDDPPMVLARRFRQAASTMGDAPAAAACGLNLLHARALRRCLALPADIQAKVNAKELPADVAARMADAGSVAAEEAVAAATDKATGKVNVRKAKKEAVRVKPIRAKTRPAPVLSAVETEMRAALPAEGTDPDPEDTHSLLVAAFVEALAYARGGEAPEWARKYVESAEQGRRAKKGGGR